MSLLDTRAWVWYASNYAKLSRLSQARIVRLRISASATRAPTPTRSRPTAGMASFPVAACGGGPPVSTQAQPNRARPSHGPTQPQVVANEVDRNPGATQTRAIPTRSGPTDRSNPTRPALLSAPIPAP